MPIKSNLVLPGAVLLLVAASALADVTLPSTSYVIVAPTPEIALDRERQLEWSARVFETLFGVRPPRGRITFSETPAGSVVTQGGISASLVNTFPLTPQPPAADGSVWNLAWFLNERSARGGHDGNFSVLTHEAAHMQLVYTVNFHSAAALKSRFNGYGSFLPDWLDEAVAVYHEPDALRAGRRTRFRLATRIPLKTFFTMNHPGESGRAEVIQIQARTPEERQKKIAAFQATQHESLRNTAEALTKDAVTVDEFYTQSLAVIEYLTARGGLPFFRFALVQQNYGLSMDEVLRAWTAKQREIRSLRSEIERASAGRVSPARAVVKGDPAGPRPPRANTIAGVLVRPGEAINSMPPSIDALEDDFVSWVVENYPRYRPALPPSPGK